MENPRIWFRSISLENVRSFGHKQTIYFTEDGTENGSVARWNVLLGDNGTGKTTVLRALACAANYQLGDNSAKFYKELSRDDSFAPTINHCIEERRNNTTQVTWNTLVVSKKQEFDQFEASDKSKFITLISAVNSSDYQPALYAYGATRRIGNEGNTEAKDIASLSLFSDDEFLTNAEVWLYQTDYAALKDTQQRNKYELVRKILLNLFRQEIQDISIDVSDGVPKVFFSTPYGDVRLHELSLGYKTLIAWMVDFAKGLLDRYPNSPNPLAEPAVCLVDEIDLHLHPKFQRNIIKFLTETFSKTQFIVTAHSPLVVQAAEDYKANLIVLKCEGDETVVTNGLDVRNWRVDQILSSDLFEGISPRGPKAEAKMARRRALLVQDSLTSEEKMELNELERELDIVSVSDSWESVKAMDIIRKAMLNQE
jgi:predicted ATP-binding protein involved in virulence